MLLSPSSLTQIQAVPVDAFENSIFEVFTHFQNYNFIHLLKVFYLFPSAHTLPP